MVQTEGIENIDIFCFGDFVLDVAQRELRKQGEPVEIEPRVFDVLLYLARNSDRAVDKDELQDAAWPGMIVTETALTRAVMKARKAVGDDASTQGVIKTIHGHGYRFVARLTPADPPPQADDSPSLQSDTEQSGRVGGKDRSLIVRDPRTWIAIGILALALLAVSWMGGWSSDPVGGESHIAVMPVKDTTGNQDWAWSRLGLMSFAAQLLSANGELTVVPEASVVSLAENFEWSGDVGDPSSEIIFNKLRTNFGASHILLMEMKSEGGMLRMNYHLLGPGQNSQSGTIVGDQPTALAQGVVQGVYGMVLRRSRLGTEFPLISEDAFNNEAFARGMSLSLGGRCAEAKQFFKVIVEQEPDLFSPRLEYAGCLRILGESEEAEQVLQKLLDELDSSGAQRPRARTLLTLGILYYRTGRPDQAMVAYTESLEIAGVLEDHELEARVLQNLSISYKGKSELDEAERLLDLAVLAYQDAGRLTLPGQLYSGRANLEMARGDFNQAEIHLVQALQAFRDIGDRRSEAMMLNNTGYLKWQQGKIDEAEESIRQSLAIRQEIGDRVGVGRTYSMLSGVYSAKGKYAEAVEAAESALEVARETHDSLFEATSMSQLANAESARGELARARQHYLDSRAKFDEIGDEQRKLQSDVQIARVDLLENRLDMAQVLAEKVLDESLERKIMEPEVDAMDLLGDIKVARGDIPAAIDQYMLVLDRIHETSWTVMETSLECKLANAFMDMGDLDAVARFAGSLAEKEQGIPVLMTRARFDFLRGNHPSATELAREAKAMAGQSWSSEDESLLQQYQSAMTP